MYVFALAALGTATDSDPEEHRAATFGIFDDAMGASLSDRPAPPQQPQLAIARSNTMPERGRSAGSSDPLLSRYDRDEPEPALDPTGLDVEMQRFHEKKEDEERQRTNVVCRAIHMAKKMLYNFYSDLPPVDEPISKVLGKCGLKRAQQFVKFAKPGAKTFYGVKQTLMVIGGLRTAAHAYHKFYPEQDWVQTCMADDTYFNWVQDPSKRHPCSVTVDILPIAVFLLSTLEQTWQNGARYSRPLVALSCRDWPADRQYEYYLFDEQNEVSKQVIRRRELTYADDTTLPLDILNGPLSLFNVVLDAELAKAQADLAEAVQAAADAPNKMVRDEKIIQYMETKYKLTHPAVFDAITRAAFIELQKHNPSLKMSMMKTPAALRIELNKINQHLKDRQEALLHTKMPIGMLGSRKRPIQVGNERDLEAATAA